MRTVKTKKACGHMRTAKTKKACSHMRTAKTKKACGHMRTAKTKKACGHMRTVSAHTDQDPRCPLTELLNDHANSFSVICRSRGNSK